MLSINPTMNTGELPQNAAPFAGVSQESAESGDFLSLLTAFTFSADGGEAATDFTKPQTKKETPETENTENITLCVLPYTPQQVVEVKAEPLNFDAAVEAIPPVDNSEGMDVLSDYAYDEPYNPDLLAADETDLSRPPIIEIPDVIDAPIKVLPTDKTADFNVSEVPEDAEFVPVDEIESNPGLVMQPDPRGIPIKSPPIGGGSKINPYIRDLKDIKIETKGYDEKKKKDPPPIETPPIIELPIGSQPSRKNGLPQLFKFMDRWVNAQVVNGDLPANPMDDPEKKTVSPIAEIATQPIQNSMRQTQQTATYAEAETKQISVESKTTVTPLVLKEEVKAEAQPEAETAEVRFGEVVANARERISGDRKVDVPVLDQVQPKMLATAQQVDQDGNTREIQLELHPKELGQIEIKIEKTATGLLNAQIRTESNTAKEVLVERIDQLRESLQNSGVKVERLDVTTGSSLMHQGGKGSDSGQQQSFQASAGFDLAAQETLNEDEPLEERILNMRA